MMQQWTWKKASGWLILRMCVRPKKLGLVLMRRYKLQINTYSASVEVPKVEL